MPIVYTDAGEIIVPQEDLTDIIVKTYSESDFATFTANTLTTTHYGAVNGVAQLDASGLIRAANIRSSSFDQILVTDIPEGISSTLIGNANGLATLDANGKLSADEIPEHLDDVFMFNNFAALPVTGETGKIYVTNDTDYQYKWNGSAYVHLQNLASNIDSVAVGNVVATNVQSAIQELDTQDTDHTNATTGIHGISGNVVGTTDSQSISSKTITSSTIDSTVIGGTTPAAIDSLDLDVTGNITVSGTVDGRDIAADGAKVDIAVLETDTSTASMSFVIDEDNMVSDSATKIPTQQSVKAYVDASTVSAPITTILAKGNYNASTNVPILDPTDLVTDIVLTGSIDPTASTDVVGVGTLFTTELSPGDVILVSGEQRIVDTITDNTNLTVTVAFSDNANDTSPEKLIAPTLTTIAKNDTYIVSAADTFFTTSVSIGDVLRAKVASPTLETDWEILDSTTISPYTSIVINTFSVFVDASDSNIDIALPLASLHESYRTNIKRIDTSTNTVTISTYGSDTIDGNANLTLTSYENITIISNGTNWFIL